jgi:dCMP deaminase
MYICGLEASDWSIVSKAMPCSMCRRMIINAGLSRVVIRDDNESYREYTVEDWVRQEEIVNNQGNDY